jgi:hypothetical protein
MGEGGSGDSRNGDGLAGGLSGCGDGAVDAPRIVLSIEGGTLPTQRGASAKKAESLNQP